MKTGGGLDISGPGGHRSTAHLRQRLGPGKLQQRRRFDDHLEHHAVADGLPDREHVSEHLVEVSGNRRPDVDHHVDLVGARIGREARLSRFHQRMVLTRRESGHHTALLPAGVDRQHRRRQAHRVHAEICGLGNGGQRIGAGGFGLEQGVVDEGRDIGAGEVGVQHSDELGTLGVVSSIPGPAADARYVLALGCPDRTGIVASISGFLADIGGWITEAAYHSDPETGWFFTRQAIRADSVALDIDQVRQRFADEVAADLGPDTEWRLTDTSRPKSAVLLVSKESHCLVDLLGRAHRRELPAEVAAVIGNHPELEELTTRFEVPFHLVPFAAERKAESFAEVSRIVDGYAPDAVVLARFMQILPPQLCTAWAGRAINIHHSFLPSFIGARPYHQAFARGVKLIGATCHYVTADLDAGPIIEQDVIRIDHGDSVADMVRQGRDIETLVLARGLRWHLEDRVLVHGRKTVVFN